MKDCIKLDYLANNDRLVAFSTTRHGGQSKGAYASMNVNRYCGDRMEDVEANKVLLCNHLRIDDKHLVMPHQIHHTQVRVVTPEMLNLDARVRKTLLNGVDALVTGEAGICIGVSTADCIPVLLHDDVNHVVAAIHAGWRGTLANIVNRTVDTMILNFGTNPQQMEAFIGPGISVEKFEVGDEVYEQFSLAGFDMERIARRYDKWHIDLKRCNQLQLEQLGVDRQRIKVSPICTYSQNEDFFSARRQGTLCGRIFSGIMMKRK